MDKMRQFREWVEANGATINVYQPDDGNGYTCFLLSIPGVGEIDMTVTE